MLTCLYTHIKLMSEEYAVRRMIVCTTSWMGVNMIAGEEKVVHSTVMSPDSGASGRCRTNVFVQQVEAGGRNYFSL